MSNDIAFSYEVETFDYHKRAQRPYWGVAATARDKEDAMAYAFTFHGVVRVYELMKNNHDGNKTKVCIFDNSIGRDLRP